MPKRRSRNSKLFAVNSGEPSQLEVAALPPRRSTEELLAAMFLDEPLTDDEQFEINARLGLPPWHWLVSEVWAARGKPPTWAEADPNQLAHWNEAAELVVELHQRFLAPRGNA